MMLLGHRQFSVPHTSIGVNDGIGKSSILTFTYLSFLPVSTMASGNHLFSLSHTPRCAARESQAPGNMGLLLDLSYEAQAPGHMGLFLDLSYPRGASTGKHGHVAGSRVACEDNAVFSSE